MIIAINNAKTSLQKYCESARATRHETQANARFFLFFRYIVIIVANNNDLYDGRQNGSQCGAAVFRGVYAGHTQLPNAATDAVAVAVVVTLVVVVVGVSGAKVSLKRCHSHGDNAKLHTVASQAISSRAVSHSPRTNASKSASAKIVIKKAFSCM